MRKKTDKILNRIPHIFIGIESERCMRRYKNKTRNIKPTSIAIAIAIAFAETHKTSLKIRFFCSTLFHILDDSSLFFFAAAALLLPFFLIRYSHNSVVLIVWHSFRCSVPYHFGMNSHGVQCLCSHLMFHLLFSVCRCTCSVLDVLLLFYSFVRSFARSAFDSAIVQQDILFYPYLLVVWVQSIDG